MIEKSNATTGIAFGCSFTSGIGVEPHEAWPSLLNAENMGQPGASNDYICRTAIEVLKQHKPEFIFVMWTYTARREWIDEYGNKLRFKPDDVKFKWEEAHLELQNSEYDKYNKAKNKLLLELYCLNANVKLYQMNMDDIDHTLMAKGTDGSHPGREWHTHVARHFNKKMVGSTSQI